ncbi:MAG: tryptophan-rich sensory protein [Flavobacteriaceae bacterium]|nr:tryptophan-rich sensory protein [Flavobacteriaceae bacterium]
MVLRLIVFLVLNFGALALGSLFTNMGISSDWYSELSKAPWTPPGWVFGAAWTTIMLCFSVYMAILWPKAGNRRMLMGLFALQWILNVSWNPTFFEYRDVFSALCLIALLTLLIGYFFYRYWPKLRWKSTLLFPYFLWLLIATSLNAYIWLNN